MNSADEPRASAANSAGSSPATDAAAAAAEAPPPPAELDPAERKKIQASEPFGDFLAKCSLVMERSLGQASSFDVMVDYAGDGGGDEQEGAGSEILKKSMT